MNWFFRQWPSWQYSLDCKQTSCHLPSPKVCVQKCLGYVSWRIIQGILTYITCRLTYDTYPAVLWLVNWFTGDNISFVSYVSCDWPIRMLLDMYHTWAYTYYMSEYPYYSLAYVSCQLSRADLLLKNMKEGLLQSNTTHCRKLGEFSKTGNTRDTQNTGNNKLALSPLVKR